MTPPIDRDALLLKPFQPHEHGFVNGRPYIRKDAIRHRLTQVDALWSISPPQVVSITNDTVILTGALTVNEASRFDVGTGIIQRFKSDGAELPPYEVSRNTQKAFKTAASDLLPRCAIQFGIGEYLKGVPRNVADERSLREWLMTLVPTVKPPQPPQDTPPADPPVVVANPMAEAFTAIQAEYDMYPVHEDKKEAFKKDVQRLQGQGKLTAKSSAADIIAAVKLDLMPRLAEAVGK